MNKKNFLTAKVGTIIGVTMDFIMPFSDILQHSLTFSEMP